MKKKKFEDCVGSNGQGSLRRKPNKNRATILYNREGTKGLCVIVEQSGEQSLDPTEAMQKARGKKTKDGLQTLSAKNGG